MEIFESNHSEYSLIFDKPYHAFNSAEFNYLNKFRCDEVKYLLFKDGKYRLGLIAGVKNNILVSSFSAPFGGFSFLKDNLQITHIENAVSLLEGYVQKNNLEGIKLILPPLFYNETFLAKLINVLYRNRYEIVNLDLDFYLDLDTFDRYSSNIVSSSRRNLKLSMDQTIEFRLCKKETEIG